MEQLNNDSYINTAGSRSYWEFKIFGTLGPKVLTYTKPFSEDFATKKNQNIFIRISNQQDSNMMGVISEITIRFGTQRQEGSASQVKLRIKHLWVSSRHCSYGDQFHCGSGYTNFNKRVYSMPMGKSIGISNFDTQATRIILYPLNELKVFQ